MTSTIHTEFLHKLSLSDRQESSKSSSGNELRYRRKGYHRHNRFSRCSRGEKSKSPSLSCYRLLDGVGPIDVW